MDLNTRTDFRLSEQIAMHCVGHRFQPVARAELFIGMMEMIPERLQGNPQSSCNFSGVLAFGEKAQDALFL